MQAIKPYTQIYCVELSGQHDAATKKYETVLWTHMADMYASKVVGV